jgi:hypothetical protein
VQNKLAVLEPDLGALNLLAPRLLAQQQDQARGWKIYDSSQQLRAKKRVRRIALEKCYCAEQYLVLYHDRHNRIGRYL